MLNQNVQEALKKFHDNKNEEYKKTQKQIKWTHRSPKYIPNWNKEHHK
jgi:hypothetical protein